jgi:peptidoglycan-N-acetylglucosamine deacetylase
MIVLTFDIEEWFHCDFISDASLWDNYEVRIHSNTDLILDTLQERKLKGTFFILGWIAERYPEVVKKIVLQGHEIGCHSYMHNLVHQMDPKSFKRDTELSLKLLEDIAGKKVVIYRAPGFSITEKTPWAFEVLADLGVEIDCSIFPSTRDYGGFAYFGESYPSIIETNGIQMKEFPMNIFEILKFQLVFSGGGYFRISPYFLIHFLAKRSDYVMSYFHPRDFDYDQPVIPHLPLQRKFKSYVGLRKAFPKFLNWISDFQVMSVGEAFEQINWEKVKTVKIN